MKSANKKILSCIILLISFRLYANSPDENKGRLLTEIKYGQSPYYGNYDMGQFSYDYFSNQNSIYNAFNYIGAYTFYNGTNDDIFRNYYFGTKAPHAKLQNNEYEVLLDYFLTSQNSIGVNLSSNNIHVDNLGYSNSIFSDLYLINFTRGNFLNITNRETSFLEGLFPYFRENNAPLTIINTFNIFYSYHFLDSTSLDPYVRIGIGYGKSTTFNEVIHKAFLSLGIRYYLLNNTYATFEAAGTNYNDFYHAYSHHLKYNWDLNDLGFKIGIGYRI